MILVEDIPQADAYRFGRGGEPTPRSFLSTLSSRSSAPLMLYVSGTNEIFWHWSVTT